MATATKKTKRAITPEEVIASFDSKELTVHEQLRNDPIAFCEKVLGFTPHKGQVELLKSDLTALYTLIVGTRQTGKTFGTAAKVAYDLFAKPGIRIFVYNPSADQSDVLMDYVRRFYKNSPYLKQYCNTKIRGTKFYVGENESLLEVVKVGIDGSTARSRSVEGNGYVISDETQGLFDGWTIAQATEPFALTNKNAGGLLYLSSPGDPDESNFFYSTYKDWSEQQKIAENEGRTPKHKVLTYKASDNPTISPEKLAEARRRYKAAGQEWRYLREYESQWVMAEGQFFSERDVKQCVSDNLPKGGRLDTYVWSMDPGGRKSPAVIMVGRFNQTLSRIEVIDVRSFIFENKYKPHDGNEAISEYEELVDVCVDLRRKYPPTWFGVDPNCEKSLTERLKNTFQFPIVNLCVGGYNAKTTFLRDLERALAETNIVWSDRRVTEQLLAFAPPKNERTGRYEYPDKNYDLIVCLGMLVRYLGERQYTPFAVSIGQRNSSKGGLW